MDYLLKVMERRRFGILWELLVDGLMSKTLNRFTFFITVLFLISNYSLLHCSSIQPLLTKNFCIYF
jgi:hypothetical protein